MRDVFARDLYDVHRIQTDGLPVSLAVGDDDRYRLQRRVRIYYASLSKPFPCSIDGDIVQKFADRAGEVERDLYPVLRVNDRPTLDTMMKSATRYIDEHVAPKDDEEGEYLRRLDSDSAYVPSLLFSPWPESSSVRRLVPPLHGRSSTSRSVPPNLRTTTLSRNA